MLTGCLASSSRICCCIWAARRCSIAWTPEVSSQTLTGAESGAHLDLLPHRLLQGLVEHRSCVLNGLLHEGEDGSCQRAVRLEGFVGEPFDQHRDGEFEEGAPDLRRGLRCALRLETRRRTPSFLLSLLMYTSSSARSTAGWPAAAATRSF